MLFPTFSFLFFFTAVFILYWFVFRKRVSRKIFLILVSYVFYAFWDWRLCFLLFASSVLNWGFACAVSPSIASIKENKQSAKLRGGRRVALVFAVITNIAILLFFKYYDFFADSFNVLMFHFYGSAFSNLMPILHVVLPVGISFYTFKGLSLVFDASDETLFNGYGNYSEMSSLFAGTANSKRSALSSTRGLIDTLVYISFFPQVASGPITHAAEFYQDIDTATESTTIDFSTASALIMSGLLKKLVFANYLSTLLVNPVFTDLSTYSGLTALLAAIGYSSVIYCDFSGYSDMAIGIALLLGFTTPKNFDRPYISCSVGDFWRRWHITFSTWLKKYLYFKMGGSRHGLPRTILALAITFIISGLWHGAHWMFVLWGAMQGLALIIEHCAKYGKKPASNSFDHAIQVMVTFAYTTISWVVFRAANFKEVVSWWKTLLASPHGFWTAQSVMSPLVITLLAVSLAMHLVPNKVRGDALSIWKATPLVLQAIFIAAFFAGLSVFSMSSVAPFIYFSF
jgi:D-alanyl-lipoteichoic acid acyltransferase DltB (MBOAT superfamily)